MVFSASGSQPADCWRNASSPATESSQASTGATLVAVTAKSQ
jgi:hypothetical protein